MLRHLKVGLLVGVAVASVLLLARHASHRLVYDYMYTRELNDFHAEDRDDMPGLAPTTTFADVRDRFAEGSDELWTDRHYPFARLIGAMDASTIIAAGCICGLISLL